MIKKKSDAKQIISVYPKALSAYPLKLIGVCARIFILGQLLC